MKLPEFDSADATTMAAWVASGEVHPSELAEAALERIEARNPALNAVVHLDAERALTAAETLPDGPFKGVPFLLKDLMAEDAGQPSTSSCRPMAGWRATEDCELVARFKRAGLNVLGRTNAPEFGIYGVTESEFRGPCRNPYDLGHTPGGSSGGSGAAVAARMVPLAHGGDGGGSIRIPSAHCGLYGLKPTRTRNPIGPFVTESWGGLVVEHVLTRSVRDAAGMLDAVHGPEAGIPSQVRPPERPFADEVGRDPGRLRIAWTASPLFGGETHAENAAAVKKAAKLLEGMGHHVEEALPTFDADALVAAYLTHVAVGTATELRHFAARLGRPLTPADVESTSWLLGRIGHKLPAPEYELQRERAAATTQILEAFFTRYDAFLTPTTAVPAVPIGTFAPTRAERLQLGLLRTLDVAALYRTALDVMAKDALSATPNTMLFNLSGHPAASLPLHVTPEGLPVGVQVVTRFGDEAGLIRLSAQLEPSFVQPLPPGLG